jgi:hypothetical protein
MATSATYPTHEQIEYEQGFLTADVRYGAEKGNPPRRAISREEKFADPHPQPLSRAQPGRRAKTAAR